MEPFFINLLQQAVNVFLLLGAALVAIWFYFRIRRKLTENPQVIHPEQNSDAGAILTLRLQACERLILFLERIRPNSLILRVHTSDMTASQLQAALIRTIREEFEYNLSQQLYLSTNAWEQIRNAKEETITQVNAAASTLKEDGSARDLAAAILQLSLRQEWAPVSQAIEEIKQEMNR
ncbi:MAG: hypothetical protein JXA23_01790 [Bacteroidales bacterium]|nr:hypothetical protein [Bacteroidales bacterium]